MEKIKVVNYRTQGDYTYPEITDLKTPSRAMEHFLLYELGFGGHIVELTPDKIIVSTNVLGTIDNTEFSGTIDVMEQLYKISCLWVVASNRYNDLILEHASNQIVKMTKGNPSLINMVSGMVIGETKIKMVLLVESNLNEAKYRERLLNLDIKTMLPVIQLYRNDGVSIEEALELAA